MRERRNSTGGTQEGESSRGRLLDGACGGWTDDEAAAIRMLRVAEPYREAVGRKQRVAGMLASSRTAHPRWFLRPAAVAVVLLGFGALASAGIWHWPAQVVRALGGQDSPNLAAGATKSRRHVGTTKARRGVGSLGSPGQPGASDAPSAPGVTVESVPVAAPVAGARNTVAGNTATVTSRPSGRNSFGDSSMHSALARVRARAELVSPTPRTEARAASDDAGPVVAAMHALRRDHDPVRARALLITYLDRNPNGALAEEALAMSIEAAVAHNDAYARTLARRYLARYPQGPFRAMARNAAQATAP